MSFSVTYETVTTAATDVRTAANTIKSQLDDLHSRVQRVVATWDGDAKEAFHATQTGWNAEVAGLHSTLMAISTALDNATAGYQSTDKSAAAQFRM